LSSVGQPTFNSEIEGGKKISERGKGKRVFVTAWPPGVPLTKPSEENRRGTGGGKKKRGFSGGFKCEIRWEIKEQILLIVLRG